jgi:hypothetical protein
MKHPAVWVAAALALIATTTPVTAQEEKAPKTDAPVKADAKADERVDRLIADLGSDDFDAREAAIEELRKLGAPAREKLEVAAKKSENKEVRWNARQVLKSMRKRARAPDANDSERAPDRPGARGEMRGELDRLRERHEQLFADMERMREALRDGKWESAIEQWRDKLDSDDFLHGFGPVDPLDRADPQFRVWTQDPDAAVKGESVSVNIEPGGRVKVSVSTTENGEQKTDTYEADSVEEFRAQHPEIAAKYGIESAGSGALFRFESGPGFGGRLRTLFGRKNERPAPAPSPSRPDEAAPPANDRLGIMVEPVDAEVAQKADLGEGEGLSVVEVEANGLAATLGVKKSDIVISINGQRIRGPETVRETLTKTRAGGEVTVEILRGEERLSLKGTKPEVQNTKRERKLEKF